MNEQQQTFFQAKASTIGVHLNDVQKQAVVKTEGPMLLLASPGSGKTTTIIMRIGYMVEVLGVHSSRIKAVTFSKASAADMRARFEKFFPYLPSVSFSTIHSLAYEVVRRKLAHDGVAYVLLEEQENGQFSKKRLLRELFEQHNKTKITEDQLEELLTYISFVKNKMLPPAEWAIPEIKVPKKVEILKSYEEYKRTGTNQLLIDFDDMLVMANDIFAHHPDMLADYQHRYDYVLTDESQDTSAVQHAIIEKLVAKHHNLCVVADEDQSIYSWRGAEPDYLLNFKQVYPSAQLLMMTQNYRSSKNIVQAANQFIKRNKKRFDKNMFTENEAAEDIVFQTLPNYSLQAAYLAKEIEDTQTTGHIAILYRNNTSAIPLLDAFERAGIPFYMKDSSIRFFTHWVVEDVLNFMRLAYNTKNVVVFEKLYRKMNGYITPKQMQAVMQMDGDECVFTKLLKVQGLKEYQPNYIKRLRQTYNSIRFDKTMPTDMLETIRKDLGYEKALQNMSESLGFNYDHLIDILDVLGLIASHTTTMTQFANRLKQLEALARTSHREQGRRAVTLSTLHSAKGLEFDRVYMIDLIEGVLPSVQQTRLDDPKVEREMEEETRLFYVGITRAIRHLQLISYSKRFKLPIAQSRFMRELHKIVVPPSPSSAKETLKVNKSAKVVKQYRNEQTILSANDLIVGNEVRHIMFGIGEIVSLEQGAIEIVFENSKKKFVVETCISQGYLERL